MTDDTVIQNQPDVTEAPTDGAVQVNEAENVTIQQGGQEDTTVAPGGQPVATDEAK